MLKGRSREMSIPLYVAVTGHRDIPVEDRDAVKERVRLFLQGIAERLPWTPISVLTGLATGADQIAAAAAREGGCRVVAVLPMPRDRYEDDFPGGELAAFRHELAAADHVVELPSAGRAGEPLARVLQYERLGAYIVSHAQILLALWDGTDSGKPGGTAAVVRFALTGVPEDQGGNTVIPDAEDTIPVYHLRVRRASLPGAVSPDRADVPALQAEDLGVPVLYSPHWESVEEKEEDAVSRAREFHGSVCGNIDRFNRDAQWVAARKPEAVSQAAEYLYPPDAQAALGDSYRDLVNTHASADALAGVFQRTTYRLLKLLLFFGVATFFWVGFFDEIYGNPLVLLLVPVFFLSATFALRRSERGDLENRFYDYRVLAEGLRVELFWQAAGIGEHAPQVYSRKLKGEIGWIIQALKNVGGLEVRGRNPSDRFHRAYPAVRRFWVEDQRRYFAKNVQRRFAAMTRQQRRSRAFFVVGMACVAGLFAVAAVHGYQLATLPAVAADWAQHVLLLLIDVAFAVGAVFSGYAEKRQFDTEHRQFRRMAALYARATESLNAAETAGDSHRMRRVLAELGREALDENGDWIVMNRTSSLELPT
jgi:hypothetical protein